MLTYIIIHLWCWAWGLKIGESAACAFAFFSVIETVIEVCIASFAAVALYNAGLRIGRENGKWYVKWDENARKRRSSW